MTVSGNSTSVFLNLQVEPNYEILDSKGSDRYSQLTCTVIFDGIHDHDHKKEVRRAYVLVLLKLYLYCPGLQAIC